MTASQEIRSILVSVFSSKYVDVTLNYHHDAYGKFVQGDWESTALKVGKFVESVTKCILKYCGQQIPQARTFKAGLLLKKLEQLNHNSYPDTLRIVIPKACLFAYEIVNNRGGRHDSDDIVANEMDARAIIPVISWVLAELVRFASLGKSDPDKARVLIEKITEKVYPYFEEIDERTYVNIDGLSARKIALLLLYHRYPDRISRQDLIDAVRRHGPSKKNAETALSRLQTLVDDTNGLWKLRGLGCQEAESLLGAIGAERVGQKS